MTKYLIINADDFGLSSSVNRGIIEAHLFGTVSSTTLMCNMPGFKNAISLASAMPALGVGLHFNLTYGKPISRSSTVPSLINRKGVFSRDSSKWQKKHITLELEAQFRRFIATGLRPTHLDSHHHIHIDFELVHQAMERLASREQIPMRISSSIADPQASIRGTDYLILDTYDNEGSMERLLGYLENLQDGITELMCHPGYVNHTVRTYSKCTNERESELLVFKDQRVVDKIRELDIRLVHFGFIPGKMQLPNSEPEDVLLTERSHIIPDRPRPLIKKKRKKLLQHKKTARATLKKQFKPIAKTPKYILQSRRATGG